MCNGHAQQLCHKLVAGDCLCRGDATGLHLEREGLPKEDASAEAVWGLEGLEFIWLVLLQLLYIARCNPKMPE